MMQLKLLPLLLSVVVGCATTTEHPIYTEEMEDEDIAEELCTTTGPAVHIVGQMTSPQSNQLPATPPVTPQRPASFPPRAWRTAEILGVQDLVIQIKALGNTPIETSEGARAPLLDARQRFTDHVLLASFEASSIAAELECEKARTNDLATRLEETQNDVQDRRTVIAIVSGGVGGVLAGGFLSMGMNALSGVFDLIGNTLLASFGLAALGGQQEHELKHERNLLGEVWRGPEQPELFPMSVWQFLNQGKPRSKRDALVSEWRKRFRNFDPKKSRRYAELLFSSGGIYGVHELRYRAKMLDGLKSAVRLMSQDLNLLFRETLTHLPKSRSRFG